MASSLRDRLGAFARAPAAVWGYLKGAGYCLAIGALLGAFGTNIGEERPWLIASGIGVTLVLLATCATWGRRE